MKNLRNGFPALNTSIYANTAAYGLLNEDLLAWRRGHDQDYLIGGGAMKMEAMANLIPETRKTVAHFFNCKVQNVSLVPNFSLAFNLLLEGLNKNSSVALLNGDYPSVNWPFAQRGHRIHHVAIDENLEHNIYECVKKEKIHVLALSLVQWLNGIRIDLDFLKTLKKDFPDLLIMADGTQFCGTVDFDFEDSAIDVLGASAYKWLLAGFGNGFMLFKDHVQEILVPQTIGFNAANGDLKGKHDIRFAKYFEPGHLDTLNFGSLNFSLNFLNSIGMHKIENQNNLLSKKGIDSFSSLSILEGSVVKRQKHSTIFNVKGDDAVYKSLCDNNVVCSERGGGIRLSFHFYNTESEIDRITEILETLR
ncbi:aminotransferase class V-fold PLP-dependent enzyme [Costertonia aggregata]|uniref:Aminotransferase class V-fold PLP-dependent enzyme n=1 Tax=Costertonia aggregata TaxID=343403 RepID=A0A7H9AM85_9FLAO|nr:aminotransferase class V-fold PLP-dependent enzyme [Costertonia aggregata]QLG44483.1 aminotransferase class V-fold PLP-dependent enzyme [Costertonia aggregata]